MVPNLKLKIKKTWIKLDFKKRWISYSIASYISILLIAAFFGDQGLIKSYKLWQKKQILEKDNNSINAEIQELSQKIYYFRDDLRTIEKYAREELKFSGENEIRFVFKK